MSEMNVHVFNRFNILCGSKFTEAIEEFFQQVGRVGFNILCGSKFTEAISSLSLSRYVSSFNILCGSKFTEAWNAGCGRELQTVSISSADRNLLKPVLSTVFRTHFVCFNILCGSKFTEAHDDDWLWAYARKVSISSADRNLLKHLRYPRGYEAPWFQYPLRIEIY